MANILLGVSGSVAAVRTPLLYDALSAAGHAVKVVATQSATHFFDPAAVGPADPSRVRRDPSRVILDEDEWPDARYERGDAVLHIELRRWADLFLVAPLSANTLAKLAVGLCDNALTSVWRAWDFARPVVLAPAMNTLMWEHPFTRRHLRSLAADFGAGHVPGHLTGADLVRQINERAKGFCVVMPVEKALACGDVGVGAMAEVPVIVANVTGMLTS